MELGKAGVVVNGLSISHKASLNCSWKRQESEHLYTISCPSLVEGHPQSTKLLTFLGWVYTLTEFQWLESREKSTACTQGSAMSV